MFRQTVYDTKINKKPNLNYPTKLNFYNDLPKEEITIEEFESLAIKRLQCNI